MVGERTRRPADATAEVEAAVPVPRPAEPLRPLENRGYLAAADAYLRRGGFSSVIASTAYYAMFYSARAALSEEGRVGRTHEGTWHLMRELFVEAGGFDPALVARATQMQQREGADYRGWTFERAESEAQVRDARRFVEAVEHLIGAEPAR